MVFLVKKWCCLSAYMSECCVCNLLGVTTQTSNNEATCEDFYKKINDNKMVSVLQL